MASIPTARQDDAALVQASLAGNREAFGEIVARYQSLVCSLAYSATGNPNQSEDLAQETFLAAWRHLVDLREPGKLRSWLCGIARHVIHNALRTGRREPTQHAEALEEIAESRSPEPLPVDRAISTEEAGILWRSLERIPETYRTPLILFYRENQSVEAVARHLDLTEPATRQRLSRGRKLLEAEVQAFVEDTLRRTTPGPRFTLAVLAALPAPGAAAKIATLGAALAKGGAATKGAWSLGALGGSLAMIGAVLFSWKTAVDESRSPAERRFMIRMGWLQLGLLGVSLGIGLYLLPRLGHRPLALGIGVGAFLLVFAIVSALANQHLQRRRLEILIEEGSLGEVPGGRPGDDPDRVATRKSLRLIVPFLIMLGAGSLGLPWREHPMRSALVAIAEALLVFWAFRRFRRLLHPGVPGTPPPPVAPPAAWKRFLTHPLVLFPALVFGSAAIAALLPLFLRPDTHRPALADLPGLRFLGWALLVALVAYALFALVYSRFGGGRFSLRPEVILDRTYAPLLRELGLPADRGARLKAMILEKTRAATTATVALIDRRLDAARRAEQTARIRKEAEEHDARIREFLGDEHHAALRRFEKTIPDRTLVERFARHQARTRHPVASEQQERLILALGEARERFAWTTELSRRNPDARDYATLFAPATLEVFADEEARFEREFLDQAVGILRPEQLPEFKALQARERQSQIAGFHTAARLFQPTAD